MAPLTSCRQPCGLAGAIRDAKAGLHVSLLWTYTLISQLSKLQLSRFVLQHVNGMDVPAEPECAAPDLGGVHGRKAQPEPHGVSGQSALTIQGAFICQQCRDCITIAA